MISDYKDLTPVQMRHLIREGKFTEPTSGLCPGYAQANLIILRKEHAYDFLLFAQRNPKACPVLEVLDTGSRFTKFVAKDCDIAKDFPKYRIYEKGVCTGEYTDVEQFWSDDLVGFLIGCSFSFESPQHHGPQCPHVYHRDRHSSGRRILRQDGRLHAPRASAAGRKGRYGHSAASQGARKPDPHRRSFRDRN